MWKEVTKKQGDVLTDFSFKNHHNQIAIYLKFTVLLCLIPRERRS